MIAHNPHIINCCLHNPFHARSDLLNYGGHFEINSKFNSDDDYNLFPALDDDIDAHAEDYDENGKLCEAIPSPWQLAFDDLRGLMRPLAATNETVLHKRIVREGHTTAAQPAGSNCRLTVHYNGYFERTEKPFDSTYLRGKPLTFVTGRQATLQGIELACLSMRVGEEAQFLIPYTLLYGELGCPVRIPPKADGLFIVHLLRSTDVGDDSGLEQLTSAERTRYAVVLPQVRNVYAKAVDAFQRTDYTMAGRMFHKAVTGLEACTLRDESEVNEQRAFVLRLYTNLALVYNKLGLPRRTCLMCNEIERLLGPQAARLNCKAMFQHGRALLQLGDFRRAEEKLRTAHRLQPTNSDITAELKLLADKKETHARNERDMCRRAFGMQSLKCVSDEKETVLVDDKDTSAFRSMTVKCLENFQRNESVKVLHLPGGLTDAEVHCVKRLIGEMSMSLEVRGGGTDDKSYVIRKTSV